MFIISGKFKNVLEGGAHLRKISDTFKTLTDRDTIITLGTLRSTFEESSMYKSKGSKYPSTNIHIDGLNIVLTYTVNENEYFKFEIRNTGQYGDVAVTWGMNDDTDYQSLFKILYILYGSDDTWSVSTKSPIELSEEEFFNEEERACVDTIVNTFEVIRKTMCVLYGFDFDGDTDIRPLKGAHVLLYLVWNCTHRGLRMTSVESILKDDIIITSTASTDILWPGDIIRVIELNLKQKVKEG